MSFFGNHEIILIKNMKNWKGEYDEKKCFSGIFRVCYLLYWLERCCILVYDWFGGSFWAVLGAVNESTWEHLKLVFWPIVLFRFY